MTFQSYVQKVGERLLFSFDPVNVSNCQFINLKNNAISGGAIICFAAMRLLNCEFHGCLAKNGGAIAVHSSFFGNYLTFKSCESINNAGTIYHQSKYVNEFNLNATAVISSKSPYFGSIVKRSLGSTIVSSLNISNSQATECVGSFEFENGPTLISFLNIDRSKANAHNGAGCIRSPVALDIKYSIFKYCTHNSYIDNVATALIIYSSSFQSKITDTYFVFCQNQNTNTLTVADGSPVKVQSCYFTGTREEELGKQVLVDVSDTTFGGTFRLPHFSYREIGFQKGIQIDDNIYNSDRIFNSATISLLIGLTIAVSFTFIHMKFHIVFNKLTKLNREML
ncbi:hypothetical protein TVAG_472180 [Trichomonas vaginalis G3]|uniref:Right handed beta helix domain-containing protein n=1 Tax=Trichomonas vaginalis (strain ATCC PRA-98 / G3) TaxID=412133 RepID=A2F5T1_TRIV3|nr:pectin lyase-like family [Trichomonas vaginalis G3]EAX99716.1 hypothetical protein TVAG_472180 [Trichomonas vaginalis G3]KAI5501427.1 pectin lyase-like family [Trichomonas vaginalis G3]|eukprot:XP_001312646.1 hypothetical protein [Trichomonas vaginalis G3]